MNDNGDNLEYRKGAVDMLGCITIIIALILLAVVVAKAFGWI